MSEAIIGAAIGAAACLAACPYLAGLVHTVPDKANAAWWRRQPVPRPELARAAVTGLVLGVLAGAAAGVGAVLPAQLALALFATPLVLIDFARRLLPNRLVFPLAGLSAVLFVLAAATTGRWPELLRAVEGAGAVFVVLFGLRRLSPGSFGRGDVKLGGVLGGFLGWYGWGSVYYGVFAGFVLGALVALALLVTRRATLKTAVPFGPMLVVGAMLVMAFDLVPAGLQ